MSGSDKAGVRACDGELVSVEEEESKGRERENEEGGEDTVPGTIIRNQSLS